MQIQASYRWNGEIQDRSLEEQYQNDTRSSDFKTIRIACALTSLAYLGGAVANYITFGVSFPLAILAGIRFLAIVAAMACMVSTRRASSRDTVDHLILFYFVILVIGDNIELSFMPRLSLPELPGFLVIILTYYMFFPTRLQLMIAGGLLAGISYSTTAGLVHGTGEPLFANGIIGFILVNAFGFYYVRNMNRVQRMKFIALLSEKETNRRLQEEIVERKRIEKKLFEQATVDALTNVFNRRHFMELAAKEFSRAKRHGHPVSLIAIDIDHFKKVNDNHGHDMGDRVLQVISQRIRQTLRKEDLMGRMGGEEFCVLLPGTDSGGAAMMAERLRAAVEKEPVQANSVEIRITASFGTAAGLPASPSDLAGKLKAADNALYAAKENGRNQVMAGTWGQADAAMCP